MIARNPFIVSDNNAHNHCATWTECLLRRREVAHLSTTVPSIAPMADSRGKAWPLADADLTNSILELVQQAGQYKQLKKRS